MATKNKKAVDLKGLDNSELLELLGRAWRECEGRDIRFDALCALEGESDLDLEREIAAAARKKAQEEAVRKKAEEDAARIEKERQANAWIRAKATEAREVLGRGGCEVRVWTKDDQRVYIGGGYDANWLIYYHDGTSRHEPGTVEVCKPTLLGVAKATAEDQEAFRGKVAAYCRSLCERYRSLKFDA